MVEDLGSSGGTYVNGSRVGRAELRSGDLVRLGQRVEFVVSRDEPSTALRDATRGSGEREVRHLQVLLEVARTLNTATVLEDVLDVVLQSAVRLMKADRALLTLLGAGQAHETLITYPRDLPRDRLQARSSLIERAIAGRATVMAKAPDDMSASMIQRGVAEAAATPLLVAHRPLGPHEQASFVGKVEVIGGLLVERDHKSGFGREEMEVLESLAADAAMALDSARLYRESRQKAKIDHEMALARGMQAALLRPPPEVPFARTWAYTRPARIVGGDLYHGILRPDGALALAVGDVSGKGVAAALIMAMVQGLAAMLHDVGMPLTEFLPVLDRNLRRYNPGNRFLTLATALVQPSGHVDLANAGHCPAAVVRADGGVEFREPRGSGAGPARRRRLGLRGAGAGALGTCSCSTATASSRSTSPGGAEFGLPGHRARAARGVRQGAGRDRPVPARVGGRAPRRQRAGGRRHRASDAFRSGARTSASAPRMLTRRDLLRSAAWLALVAGGLRAPRSAAARRRAQRRPLGAQSHLGRAGRAAGHGGGAAAAGAAGGGARRDPRRWPAAATPWAASSSGPARSYVDTRGLARVLAFDAERGHIEVEAGIQWPELIAGYLARQEGAARPWGIAQKQTGADRLTLGGSVSCNAHGRGLTFAPLVGDVEALRLLDARGEWVSASRDREPRALPPGGRRLRPVRSGRVPSRCGSCRGASSSAWSR